MSTSNNTPDYHFSPALRDWAKCSATIQCRLDHVSAVEYEAIQNIKAEEATLTDSSLGKAEISYINAKTNLNASDIKETLRELRREGSRLPAPTAEEIEVFLEQERFKVENDSTLSNKERREILKDLKTAEKELSKNQEEITGGVLHAWRNGLTASLARIRKPLLVGALAGGLAFGLAACAPNQAPQPGTPPEKNDKETVQVEECGPETTVSGDVIPGELKSNSSGEYCSIVIDPESSALVYDKSKVDPALYELGYTDEQLENMQKQAVRQTVEKLLDNPSLGKSSEETREWVSKEGPSFLRQEVVDASLKETDDYIKIYDVYAGSYSISPPAVYDGGTRFTQVTVDIKSINIRKADSNADTSAANDAEVSLNVTSTERIDSSVYDEWKTSLLTNTGYPHYVEYLKDEPFDREKPALLDVEKEFRIGYNAEDIKEGGELKIRSISSKIDEIFELIPYNS